MLELYFFNVGHGDSIAIKFPSGEWGLIDCCKNTNEIEPNVLKFLKKQDVKRLSFICITHPHEDHFYGIDNVVEYFGADNIDKFILYGIMTGSSNETDPNSSLLKALKEYLSPLSAKKRKEKMLIANKGLNFSIDEVSIDCYNPNDIIRADLQLASYIKTRQSFNKLSIVLLLKYNDVKVLFTGDAEPNNLLKNEELLCDVVKIPHHGSKNNNTNAVLNSIVRPNTSTSIISAGKLYQLPDQEVVSYLENVIKTNLCLTSELNNNENPQTTKFILSNISKSLLNDISTEEEPSKIVNPDGYILVQISKDGKITNKYVDVI